MPSRIPNSHHQRGSVFDPFLAWYRYQSREVSFEKSKVSSGKSKVSPRFRWSRAWQKRKGALAALHLMHRCVAFLCGQGHGDVFVFFVLVVGLAFRSPSPYRKLVHLVKEIDEGRVILTNEFCGCQAQKCINDST